jgi:hypothetical protein
MMVSFPYLNHIRPYLYQYASHIYIPPRSPISQPILNHLTAPLQRPTKTAGRWSAGGTSSRTAAFPSATRWENSARTGGHSEGGQRLQRWVDVGGFPMGDSQDHGFTQSWFNDLNNLGVPPILGQLHIWFVRHLGAITIKIWGYLRG